jgi:hypothetical protein
VNLANRGASHPLRSITTPLATEDIPAQRRSTLERYTTPLRLDELLWDQELLKHLCPISILYEWDRQQQQAFQLIMVILTMNSVKNIRALLLTDKKKWR